MDEDVDRDESSEYIGVRPRVTARLVAPTPAVIPCGRAAPVGSRGTAAATSLRGAAMRDIPGIPVHSSAGTTGGFVMSTSPATSAGVNASRGTASPGALAEWPSFVSEEDEVDDGPSPKLGGRAAHELRWLGETPSSGRDGLVESKSNLIWIRRRCLLKKRLLLKSSRNGCQCLSCTTVLPESMACITRCCLAP